MRKPEIRGDIVNWGMVYYSRNTRAIRFADPTAPYEPHEWDDLLEQLKAAIRYARKVAK